MESCKESAETVSSTEELSMLEVNGDMELEENTSQLNEQAMESLTPVLDENTSFTKHQFSQIVKDADWNELRESSFKLHAKENSAVLADGSDCSTEDVDLSALLKTSLCASPKKGNVFRKSVLRNRNIRSENVVCESGNFQEVLQQSTDTDESCIETRKSIKSGFRRGTSAATNNKRTSKFSSTEFLSAFNSSAESVNRSKLSVTVNSDDSIIVALNERRSSCFTRKKLSDIKNSCPIDFQNAFNSSADDSQVNLPRKKRINCDVSLNESVVKKRNSGFLKKRGKHDTSKVDFQNIFNSSEESTQEPQRKDNSANKDKNISVTKNENLNCNKDNIEPNVSNKSTSEQTHDEKEENQLNEKTGNITELLRNNGPPETDEVQISRTLSEKVNAEKEESLLKDSKSLREGSAEDWLGKDKSGIQSENISRTLSEKVNAEKEESLLKDSKSLREGSAEDWLGKDKSGIQSENTSKTCGEVLDAIERSFTGTEIHSLKQQSLVVSKVSDVSSRCYISNMSLQENSSIPPVSNDSPIKPGEIRKPDSLSSLVLQLDDYDSMDSGSETDDSRTAPGDNNVNAVKNKIQPDETSFRKGTEKDISDNNSLRRSSRKLSKTDSNTNKKDQSDSAKINFHEKSATKADDINTSMVVESNSFDRIGSKEAIGYQSNVLVNNASDYYNSLETTNDDTIAAPNNYSSQNNTNKEESVFKVPTADISSRVHSLRRKKSPRAQNISTEKSYQLTKNSSVSDKSAYRDNDSKERSISSRTKRRKSQRTPQSNYENSSENTMLNCSSIDSKLRREFSELKRRCNKDGDQLLIDKVFSFGNKKFQEVNKNDVDVEENYLNKNVKLKKPKKWVSDHLYNFLIKKLEPKYDFKARFRAEKFVQFLCEKYDIVVKEKVDFKRYVDELILEMAKLHIIVNVFDFYNFVLKFLPHVFSEKSVPCTRPFGLPSIVVPPPASTLFDNIL